MDVPARSRIPGSGSALARARALASPSWHAYTIKVKSYYFKVDTH